MTEEIVIREQWFRISVFAFTEYENNMLQQFYDYWSEPTKSGKKMRFELEKTWDVKRRLKRWYDNQNKWYGNEFNSHGNKSHNNGSAAGAITLLNNLKRQFNT